MVDQSRARCTENCTGFSLSTVVGFALSWGSRRGSHLLEVSEGALEDAALETVGGNLL